jgi:hypothetical protein
LPTISSYTLHFLILTATTHTPPRKSSGLVIPSGLGIGYEYDSDNAPEVSIRNTTYSGSGLLLVRCEDYLSRGKFHDMIGLAEKRLEVRLAQGGSEEYVTKSMIEELEALTGLVQELEKHQGTAEEGRHFRRMGVVEFNDWTDEVYRKVMCVDQSGERMERIWID